MAGFFRQALRLTPKLFEALPARSVNHPSVCILNAFSTSTNVSSPRVTQPAPFFQGDAVINGGFKNIKLTDFKGQYVVLFFYPLDFTFVCPTELVALEEAMPDFKKANTTVVACSVDSKFSHLAWQNLPRKSGGVGPLSYPVLSDINKLIARAYSVLLEDEGVALRGQFIIDPKGILRQIIVNDLPIGRSIEETLRVIDALEFHEKHGEVCPAGWQKGGKTIKPDPKKSQEYFQSV